MVGGVARAQFALPLFPTPPLLAQSGIKRSATHSTAAAPKPKAAAAAAAAAASFKTPKPDVAAMPAPLPVASAAAAAAAAMSDGEKVRDAKRARKGEAEELEWESAEECAQNLKAYFDVEAEETEGASDSDSSASDSSSSDSSVSVDADGNLKGFVVPDDESEGEEGGEEEGSQASESEESVVLYNHPREPTTRNADGWRVKAKSNKTVTVFADAYCAFPRDYGKRVESELRVRTFVPPETLRTLVRAITAFAGVRTVTYEDDS